MTTEFGKLKQNLSVDDRVVLGRLGGDQLEGAYGTILGKSFVHAECDFYIVLLDDPTRTSSGAKAVCIIESCIAILSNT
jgi:hypothetical protein